jgi:uncharacterized protein (TIGR02145 family)
MPKEKYTIVNIGTQTWMDHNLNIEIFRNGELIPEARSKEDWEKADRENRPVWCYYNNDPSNGLSCGKLYNWHAISDARGLAPKGWHIPSDEEWTILSEFLSRDIISNPQVIAKTEWINLRNGSNYLCGCRSFSGIFQSFNIIGNWWSSTEKAYDVAWDRSLDLQTSHKFLRGARYKGWGFSVRCVQDSYFEA